MVKDSVTKMAKYERYKTTGYRDPEYLIKPGTSGARSLHAYFGKPTTALKGAFAIKEITCEGVNWAALSLNDIRRSSLVLLQAPKNEKFFTVKGIAKEYNLKISSALKWHKELATSKYHVKK